MISVGLVLGGGSESMLKECIQSLMRFLESQRQPSTALVTLIFRVPGMALPATFYGVEVGNYDPKRAILDVEIGVEEEWLRSDRAKSLQYLHDVADEAIGNATGWLESKGIAYDIGSARELLDAWLAAESVGE